MVAYLRTVKTASKAIAVQIVWSSRRESRSIEHLGSAHDEAELAALKAAAAERWQPIRPCLILMWPAHLDRSRCRSPPHR